MSRFLLNTRYLILIPIVGLTIAAAFFFVSGGIGLLELIFELMLDGLGLRDEPVAQEHGIFIFEVVEYVHNFLVGTVLYITATGFYQLFIAEVDFPKWMKVHNTEELETNLISVTVVVLAVNFMGESFSGGVDELLQYGAGIALPIAALGVFLGLRAWAVKMAIEAEHLDAGEQHASTQKHDSRESAKE